MLEKLRTVVLDETAKPQFWIENTVKSKEKWHNRNTANQCPPHYAAKP